MPIIDFHNHYYPPSYLDALRSGSSAVEVTIDGEGNPRIHYPGDYNIAVRGHRDIDYREQVLIDQGVDTQVITHHARHARRAPLHRRPVCDVGERCIRRGGGYAARPLRRARHAAAE